MSDPEILDAEGESNTGSQATSDIERMVAEVQRALPGRTVRVSVESRPPVPPRFRLEAEGEGGSIIVESGPFSTVNVSFHAARFGFPNGPGTDHAAVHAAIAARVKALADEELVVFEEPAAAPLQRTVVLAVAAGRIVGVVDAAMLPGNVETGRLRSFRGTWNRAPSKHEKARIDAMTGGIVGKLKRKLFGKVVSKVAGSLLRATEQLRKGEESQPSPKLPSK